MEHKKDRLKEKPKILPLLNGPFYLLNDMELKVVENLQTSEGEPLSNARGIALCRCGASKNKPFCDGTHGIIGSSSKNSMILEGSTNIKDRRKNYVGKKNIIHDNRKMCSHAAECVNNLPSVFKLDARPWISPDSAKSEHIIKTIEKCPSGSLSYSIDGIEYRDQNKRKPLVTVLKDGPYAITGGIDLIGDDIQFAEGFSKEHYTLCRCGASNNKPFCDGTDRSVNFTD